MDQGLMARIWIINHYASTPDTGFGGRHPYLAEALAGRGHNVALVAARQHHLLIDTARAAAKPKIEETAGYRFVRLDVPRYAHAHDRRRILAWFDFAWDLRLLPRLLGEAPDVVLCSSPSLVSYLGAERLARRTGARLVFEVRDIWPLTLVELGGASPRHPFIRFLQWIEDRAYRNADRVISNLPRAVDHMVTRGFDPAKFAWIPNGFSQAEVSEALPLDPGFAAELPRDVFLVGYVGTLGLSNGLEPLLDAAALLRDRKDIAFLLVGGGREKAALVAHAAREGLGNVHFRDAVPKRQVPSLLARCDVCYAGLRRRGLYRYGIALNKLFDYLAAGRPVLLAADAGGYRPVEEAGAGCEVPPEDPTALAEAILAMRASPPETLAEMGARGRALAYARHEYGTIAARLEDVLLSGLRWRSRGQR
jgi:glycosyltransferase involved in cell wall biosynthesis